MAVAEQDPGSELPPHLRRYVVDQDYSRYTPVDQAAWRHIMRQLKSFLAVHAHESYLDGLVKTGIEIDRIPRIEEMSEKLTKFGWQAVPVSGFIPPAAFMELQSLGVLPIASDMRSVDHLLYTPAPDIVHEAAGHAPILVDPAFASYLKSYAQVARKAILSQDDMDQYEAIRVLSDMKEDPSSTPAEIARAEKKLTTVTAAMSDISEAALLGRMNWWTAEYGLIGDLKNPKIFGAGLLSSVGESRSAMSDAVKKIPLSIDCIEYAYDITEQQPQLFVVPQFEMLGEVLEELANRMAFRRGGAESVEKTRRAKTVNTIELDSGLQISGRLKSFIPSDDQPRDVAYLSFEGPTQLSSRGREIPGQGVAYHREGFGSPLGVVTLEVGGRRSATLNLISASQGDLESAGLRIGADVIFRFSTGVEVRGRVEAIIRDQQSGVLQLVTLAGARAKHGETLLFDPAWGTYDMAIGTRVTSVFGGPADREAYGETEEFTKKLIPRRVYTEDVLKKHALYERVEKLRRAVNASGVAATDGAARANELRELGRAAGETLRGDWLIHTQLLEIAEDLAAKYRPQSSAAENSAAANVTAEVDQLRSRLGARLAEIRGEDPLAARHIADAEKTLHSS